MWAESVNRNGRFSTLMPGTASDNGPELNSARSISPLLSICTALGWSPSVALENTSIW